MGAAGTSSNTLTVTPATSAPFSIPDVAYRARRSGRRQCMACASAGCRPRRRESALEVEWNARQGDRADQSRRASGPERSSSNRTASTSCLATSCIGFRPAAAAGAAVMCAAARDLDDRTSNQHSVTRTRSSINTRRPRVAGGRRTRVSPLAVRLRHRRCAHHARQREASARRRSRHRRQLLHPPRGLWRRASGCPSSHLTVTRESATLPRHDPDRSARPSALPCSLLLGVVRRRARNQSRRCSQSLPADFAHLFTPANGIIVGVGGAGSAAIHPKDDEIAAKIARRQAGGMTSSTRRRDARRRRRTEQLRARDASSAVRRTAQRVGALGADLVDAQIVNGVLTQGLKAAVDRRRPTGSKHSFPSGHTSATLATAVGHSSSITAGRSPRPSTRSAGTSSLSRMVDDSQHWASDVIFERAVGIVSGRAASVGHGVNRVSVSPSVLPGGFAIVGAVG